MRETGDVAVLGRCDECFEQTLFVDRSRGRPSVARDVLPRAGDNLPCVRLFELEDARLEPDDERLEPDDLLPDDRLALDRLDPLDFFDPPRELPLLRLAAIWFPSSSCFLCV